MLSVIPALTLLLFALSSSPLASAGVAQPRSRRQEDESSPESQELHLHGKPPFVPAATPRTDALAAKALGELETFMGASQSSTPCTFATASRRKEWSALSAADKMAYTSAVKCLQGRPSQHDGARIAGARTRYDDFVVVHMNQTATIHNTASFLAWHRAFTALFERALRAECGFAGAQPYWNWPRYAHDPAASPLFDGRATSLGGNGAPLLAGEAPRECTRVFGPGSRLCVPPGAGGGCVVTGPFANLTVNLGPVSPTETAPGTLAAPPDDLFRLNARCLRRDISAFVSARFTTEQNCSELIETPTDVVGFQTLMQGDITKENLGVHGGGHFTVMGDPAGDFFISPGDPAFWLHHAQIDRMWWVWQNLAPADRTAQVGGSITPLVPLGSKPGAPPLPPGRNGTLDDIIDMGILSAQRPIRDFVSTVGIGGGDFCYVYE